MLRVLRSQRGRLLLGAWARWADAGALRSATQRASDASSALDAARREAGRLRRELQSCRNNLAAERGKSHSARAGDRTGDAIARRLRVEVSVLKERLHTEQAMRASAERKHAAAVHALDRLTAGPSSPLNGVGAAPDEPQSAWKNRRVGGGRGVASGLADADGNGDGAPPAVRAAWDEGWDAGDVEGEGEGVA